jgi:hypothetical protein
MTREHVVPESLDRARWGARRRHQRHALRRLVASHPDPHLLTGVPGNTGDLLIAAGVDAAVGDLVGRVPYGEHHDHRGGTLVVPGSGAWSRAYHEWLPELVLAATRRYQRVLVLPSSYDPSVPVVRRALEQPTVTAVSRESVSAGLVAPFGHGQVLLDCAVHAPELRRPTRRPPHAASLVSLRTDAESALGADRLPPGNRDLSAGWPDLEPWLAALHATGHVVTDRAHVVIAAVLLGRDVDFTDGGYWKNRAMAELTFGRLFSGRLRYRTADELLSVVAPC